MLASRPPALATFVTRDYRTADGGQPNVIRLITRLVLEVKCMTRLFGPNISQVKEKPPSAASQRLYKTNYKPVQNVDSAAKDA